MKASVLRKFYLTFIRLYGVIDSDESFKIIKKFYPDFKKSEYLKDLRDRSLKMTRDYWVRRTDKRNEFIIQNEYFDDELIEFIFQNMAMYKKEYYILDNLDEYLAIGKNGLDISEATRPLKNELIRRGMDENEASFTTAIFYEKVRTSIDYNKPIQLLLDAAKVEDADDAQILLNAYAEFNKNVRLYTNGGFTPLELREKRGPIDFENVEIDLGPNIRDRLMEEDDPEEFIRMLEENDTIPAKAKESMIKQLKEIALLKKTEGKA